MQCESESFQLMNCLIAEYLLFVRMPGVGLAPGPPVMAPSAPSSTAGAGRGRGSTPDSSTGRGRGVTPERGDEQKPGAGTVCELNLEFVALWGMGVRG